MQVLTTFDGGFSRCSVLVMTNKSQDAIHEANTRGQWSGHGGWIPQDDFLSVEIRSGDADHSLGNSSAYHCVYMCALLTCLRPLRWKWDALMGGRANNSWSST
ncbi:hypothetical protein AALO_G00291280 [Alosa alosa]|uniref:Uncharacterized protein n=1 Tax=Alosa alosa TaxID=278164 RepID=A0AAV6FLR1_9TELE|nr:hypothetical protein AALO_G00291280 [Alosa alosa]